LNRFCCLALLALVFGPGANLIRASGISFTCDPSINADATANGYSGNLCTAIQTIVGGEYSNLFTNANASIYIEFNSTPNLLGGSTSGGQNFVSYTTYRAALAAASSSDTVDGDVLANLPQTLPGAYPTGADIELTSALVQALGITTTLNGNFNGTGTGTRIYGTTSTGGSCVIGQNGCYNGLIELGTPADLASELSQGYYYGSTGTPASNQYDIYSVIEHEADEILGTASCISTTTSTLTDTCTLNGTQSISAVDLFRYDATTGMRAAFPTTDEAYFSYDGGATIVGYYNHSANGQDYADFNSIDSGPFYQCTYVQDAEGCLGGNPRIGNDGGAEVDILDAVGYNTYAPEPGTVGLFGCGVAMMAGLNYLRRKPSKPPSR
jgi:hypothetical protein